MSKKTILVVFAVLLTSTVQANAIKIDGCAELARVVYDEVQASVLYGPGKSGPWYIGPEQGEIRFCDTVAETVSRAFTQAMASAGHKVYWPAAAPGEHLCLSAYLSQCRPGGGGSMPPAQGEYLAWKVVSGVVMQHMYNPRSSNEVRFRSDELRLRLGLALRNSRSTFRQ